MSWLPPCAVIWAGSRREEDPCGHEFSPATILAMVSQLDASLKAFAERGLEGVYPYVLLDARYEKVRSRAVQIAIGMDGEGSVSGAWVTHWGDEKGVGKLVEWVEDHVEETLTVYRLSREHRSRMKSTNMLERYNEELRRRTRVIRIFPNAESCLRLILALTTETHERWMTGRRYLYGRVSVPTRNCRRFLTQLFRTGPLEQATTLRSMVPMPGGPLESPRPTIVQPQPMHLGGQLSPRAANTADRFFETARSIRMHPHRSTVQHCVPPSLQGNRI